MRTENNELLISRVSITLANDNSDYSLFLHLVFALITISSLNLLLPGSKCIDRSAHCADYKKRGLCTEHADNMLYWCPVTCDLCSSGTSGVISYQPCLTCPSEAKGPGVQKRHYFTTGCRAISSL